MSQTRKVRLFKNGASQAVRLPAEFRFPGEEIYATRDENSGDVTLSTSPGIEVWDEIFSRFHSAEIPDDFMKDRPMNRLPVDRDIFGEKPE
jgi:antitoxin VapB